MARKTKMKKLSAVTVSLLLAFFLVACGSLIPQGNNENPGIDIDYELLDGDVAVISNAQGSYLPADKYLEFADSEYLNDSVFSANVAVISTSAKMIDVGSGVQLKIYGAQNDTTAEAKLCGISSNAALGDFVNGKRSLVNGRMFETKNECIISEKLADHNKLSLGDELMLENITLGTDGKKIEYRLTVVGIFSDDTKEYDSGYKVPYLNRRNEIFTDISTVMEAENAGNDAGVMMEAQYYLKDGITLSDFEKELRDKGLPSGFRVGKK